MQLLDIALRLAQLVLEFEIQYFFRRVDLVLRRLAVRLLSQVVQHVVERYEVDSAYGVPQAQNQKLLLLFAQDDRILAQNLLELLDADRSLSLLLP